MKDYKSNSGIIDLSEELQAIKTKYGERYYLDPRATKDAAALWGIKTNKHGVAADVQTETLIKEKTLIAEIYLAPTLKKHWLIGINAHTSMAGIGYMPSAWCATGYTNHASARKEAIMRLKDFFSKSASDKQKHSIIQKLSDKEIIQLTLF